MSKYYIETQHSFFVLLINSKAVYIALICRISLNFVQMPSNQQEILQPSVKLLRIGFRNFVPVMRLLKVTENMK